MPYITRFIPHTNPKRQQVLTAAKEMKDAPGTVNVLSAPTTARLDIIQPAFDSALSTVAAKKVASTTKTRLKNESFDRLYLLSSHFLQVFNFAVERGVFPKEDRAYYKLNVESFKLPDMITDAQLEQVAKDIKKGETDRVAAGGAAMAMPTAAQVDAELVIFKAAIVAQKAAGIDLDTAQEAVDALHAEADGVIRKIYDEAEAFYNEEEPSSQRDNCRDWGVIYITIGEDTNVTVKVKRKHEGDSNVGIEIELEEAAGKRLITGANGEVLFVTKVVGAATLYAYLTPGSDDADATLNINIEEGVGMVVEMEV